MDAEIVEMQQLIIATGTMLREDWVKTRAFCWMAGLLHFDKVLQIPLVIVHEVCGLSYRELIESFSDANSGRFPVLAGIKAFFADKATDIQNGGVEYCQSAEWLNIFWPADEYVLIKLCVEGKLAGFYREAEALLAKLLKDRFLELPPALLHDAVTLNHALMKLPFQTTDTDVVTSYNVWEFYQLVLVGEQVPLQERKRINHIDRTSKVYPSWEIWFREVIWYGNKKGAYLYGNNLVEPELAGHY